MSIEVHNVSKRFGSFQALDDVSVDVASGSLTALLGPSGSGKSTLLRIIAGLEIPDTGEVRLAGEDATILSPQKRGVGFVFQHYAAFKHMTVRENIATVPRLLGWPAARVAARVRELLNTIGLDAEEMSGRYPAQLSGGQRQRVGVARALAADPPLMLMDEPFGAIDPINRAKLQDEFLGLQAKVRKTIVFVTHDIDEAIKMGDRIAILREGGVLAQYDTPKAILARPADDFVAQFVGADRGIKRLSLTTLGEIRLLEPDGQARDAKRVPASASVKDALSILLTDHGRALAVVDGDDRVLGLLTLSHLERLIAEEADGDEAPSASAQLAGRPGA